MGGNVNSYIKLLQKFSENQADAISGLSTALDSGDTEKAVRSAHTLKGVSGNIGATDLQNIAAKLENAIIDGAGDTIGSLLEEAGTELGRTIALIEGLGSQKKSVNPTGSKQLPEGLLQQLQVLLEKLDEYDSAAEDLLIDILNDVEGTPVHAMLAGIKKKISQYDLEGAAVELKPLIEQLGQTGKGNA